MFVVSVRRSVRPSVIAFLYGQRVRVERLNTML